MVLFAVCLNLFIHLFIYYVTLKKKKSVVSYCKITKSTAFHYLCKKKNCRWFTIMKTFFRMKGEQWHKDIYYIISRLDYTLAQLSESSLIVLLKK